MNQSAIWRRHINPDNGKLEDEEVEVHSQELKNLLAEASPWSRDSIVDSDQHILAESPFYDFVWHWEEHLKACEPKENDEENMKLARQDLKNLMQLVSSSQTLKSYFRARDSLLRSKKIKFEFLWTLFGHATKVYARSYMNELQMFEVKNCYSPPYSGHRFKITCSALDWDGTTFQTYNYDFYINDFTGEKPINSLDVIPVDFYPSEQESNEQLQSKLLNRGRKYFELCTGAPITFQCEYQGTALITPTGVHRLSSKTRSEWSYSQDARTSVYETTEEIDVTSIDITGKQSRVIADNFSFLKSGRNTMRHGDGPPLGLSLIHI